MPSRPASQPPSAAHVARRRIQLAKERSPQPTPCSGVAVDVHCSPSVAATPAIHSNATGFHTASKVANPTTTATDTAPTDTMTTGEVSGAEAAVAASAADGAAPAGAAAQSAAATPAQDRSGAIVPALELGCATLSFEQPAGLPLPRLVVHARKRPIEDADVTAALAFIAAVLERREWFTILYDLRESSVPSRAQLKVGLAWAGEFTPQLDANLCGIGIVLTSRVVRSVVKFVLHVCKPPVPQCVCSEQDTALSFARECAGPPAKPGETDGVRRST